MTNVNNDNPLSAFNDLLKGRIELKAQDISDAMSAEFKLRLNKEVARIASELSLTILNQVSMHKAGSDLVITIRMPEAGSK